MEQTPEDAEIHVPPPIGSVKEKELPAHALDGPLMGLMASKIFS
jgi:hypothetical protein